MPTQHESTFSAISVLVVDDQDYVRSIVAQLLKRLGIGRIFESANGSDALELLKNNSPDLILCDIKMAPIDGIEFLHDVRSGKGGADRHVPIIFLTSASDRATVQAAMEGNVDGYLIKPVSADELRTKITTILTRRAVERGVSWKQSG